MKKLTLLVIAAATVGAVMAAGPAAQAKGCIKGAIVGGVAGFFMWLSGKLH